MIVSGKLKNVDFSGVKKKRIWEIDLLRGIAVIFMVFDHMMFDFSYFPSMWSEFIGGDSFFYRMWTLSSEYWEWNVRIMVRIIIISFFFVSSGISSSFSKSNFMRGARLLCVSFLLTIGTMLADAWFDTGLIIDFGVLHCMAVSILVFELLKRAKLNNWMLAVLGIAIMLFGAYIYYLPYYAASDDFVIFGLATRSYWYSAADYFPIMPWTGLFILGGVLGNIYYKDRKSLFRRGDVLITKPFKFIGRHALIIYFGHQIVLFVTFYLIGMSLGYF